MDIHVDTEFTSLSDPRLIAIGALAGDTRAFYGIVSDFPKRACTRFVIEHVLPALDANPADVILPHDALARAFCNWLAGLAASGNEGCRLIVDDECDRELVERLLHEQQVLVTPGDFFRPVEGLAMRIGLGGNNTRLLEGLERLRHGLQTIG